MSRVRIFLYHRRLSHPPHHIVVIVVVGDKDICVGNKKKTFINITQYDHVMTQNENKRKGPRLKRRNSIYHNPAETRETQHFVCVHVPSGVLWAWVKSHHHF